ncbi:MAG: SOS response-associated peptidase [Chloroflexota bacterium]|nr:SOS response-associated peptidase [Chloroflexota bacterium]MDE2959495.1 SOS response-associated peptidase [Chloroflexota bacterium]
MCGRFGLFADLEDLADHFDFRAEPLQASYLPRWNIPPTSPVLTVLGNGHARAAGMMRWGLMPSQTRNDRSTPRLLFNARAETIDRRTIFRNAFAARRCLVPANGFYEWPAGTERTKTPQWISQQDGHPVAFAGIWYAAQSHEEAPGSCVIITTAANSLVAPIHNRMPVILPPEQFDAWLSRHTEPAELLALLGSRDWPDMSVREVSTAANRVANDGPHLIDADEPTGSTQRLFP